MSRVWRGGRKPDPEKENWESETEMLERISEMREELQRSEFAKYVAKHRAPKRRPFWRRKK